MVPGTNNEPSETVPRDFTRATPGEPLPRGIYKALVAANKSPDRFFVHLNTMENLRMLASFINMSKYEDRPAHQKLVLCGGFAIPSYL